MQKKPLPQKDFAILFNLPFTVPKHSLFFPHFLSLSLFLSFLLSFFLSFFFFSLTFFLLSFFHSFCLSFSFLSSLTHRYCTAAHSHPRHRHSVVYGSLSHFSTSKTKLLIKESDLLVNVVCMIFDGSSRV